jgi:hypothetical protein
MPRIKRKRVGDVGIRLKPVENNLLENYNEFSKRRKKTRKKRQKKIKKPKRTVTKSVEIQPKIDPLYKIMEESRGKPKEEIEVKELSDVDKDKDKDKVEEKDKDKPEKEHKEKEESKEKSEEEPQFKKIQVHEGKRDLTEKDPNIKTLNITASLEPEKKKKGGGILLE